jgi:hypothetical protein
MVPSFDAHGTPDESLAAPVGGNALNPEGDATHNPDRLGAGTPEGTPEAEATDTAPETDGPSDPATDGEGEALDNDEIEDQADELSE